MEILDILLGFENHLDNHESSKIYEMRGCEVFAPEKIQNTKMQNLVKETESITSLN